MNKASLAILVLAAVACSQTNLISPLPKNCSPGDLIDNYGPPSRCIATGVWEAFPTIKEGVSCPMVPVDEAPWTPDCSWAFQDKTGSWHCPYETASGRTIGCVPCSGKRRDDTDCKKWYGRCQRRVALMKSKSTVEASSFTVPKDEETDRTARQHWKCPTGYTMDWLGDHDDWDSPLCVK